MNPYREYDQQQLSDALQLSEDLAQSLADVTRERDDALRELAELRDERDRARRLRANFLDSVRQTPVVPATGRTITQAEIDGDDLGRVVSRDDLWAQAHEAREELRQQMADHAKRDDQHSFSERVCIVLSLVVAVGAVAVMLWCFATAVRPQANKPGGPDPTVEWWLK